MKYWFLLCLLLFNVSAAAAGPLFEDRTEAAGYVETTPVGYDSRKKIYTVGPFETDGNTCYLLNAQYEISNKNPDHNIMVGQTIIRHSEPADDRGIRIMPATARNVDRERHHEPWNGSIVDCPPLGKWYYSLNVYSALNKKIKPSIVIEQGYGFLQVWRLWFWKDEMDHNKIYQGVQL